MQPFKQQFIELAIEYDALCFGEFTLKSGRLSPYFFNAGRFCTADALSRLGSCYAAAALEYRMVFDMVFGPAYKGIPLVTAMALALVREHSRDVPVAFNRKEAKDHGEGGNLIGAPISGRVLIVDDVVTAGTAVRAVAQTIKAAGASVAGILIGLDRRERGLGQHSATSELQKSVLAPVMAIISIDNVIDYLASSSALSLHLQRMNRYREQWSPADDEGSRELP